MNFPTGNMPSTLKSGHTFSQVPKAEIPRSSFDRSHGLKTAFNSGYLVPIFVDEVLPGDTFNLRATLFARLSTLLKPVMDNLRIDTFFFFVPDRLVWTNFKKSMGEQANPADSTTYLRPVLQSPASGDTVGSLADYMGIPTVGQVAATKKLTYAAIPFRAYNLIWNEWFRDENLQNSLTQNTGDGPDSTTDYSLQKRGKRHDYFTSCLPWTQKATAVTVPLGTTARVASDAANGADLAMWSTVGSTWWKLQSNNTYAQASSTAGTASNYLYADLTNASAATINSLRQAFQLQRMYERDARGGTRYTELVRAHFGVVSPDARLQRPEYLGGGSSPIQITPVPQTAITGTTPQGNLAATGVAVTPAHGFVKSFTEHGTIIGLACVYADLTYQQGLNRMWSRRTRTDLYWPALSHLGEQAVLNKEIYATDDTAAQDDQVFGYQERYAEYRYKPSQITGIFRSTATGTLDVWHLAQKFTALPTLNSTFIQESPPVDRVVAVNTEPQILLDAYFKLNCARPMPVYSVPGQIDRF